jgi:hypothetical protein
MWGESMVGADPEPRMGSSGSRIIAWIAFGVYLLSLLPGGFLCFYVGCLCFLDPLIHTLPPQSDYWAVLFGISWLANPILLVGMVALGVIERGTAALLGILALGCALGATQVNFFFQVLWPAYLIWLCSIGLVFYGALRPVRPPQARPVSPERMPTGSPRETRPLRTSDGKPLSKREEVKMMELYDELP